MDLPKYIVHDSGCQQDLPVGKRHRGLAGDGGVKRGYERLQSGIVRQVKVPSQEFSEIPIKIAEILSRVAERGDEVPKIALVFFIADFNDNLVVIIDDK